MEACYVGWLGAALWAVALTVSQVMSSQVQALPLAGLTGRPERGWRNARPRGAPMTAPGVAVMASSGLCFCLSGKRSNSRPQKQVGIGGADKTPLGR